ncbi:MAG: glycosyltransferase family 39 protein [Anaerolineae bacterium]|jgi:4-amino-4-deoxy-L-arabinose transferase-like glycosyltransferase
MRRRLLFWVALLLVLLLGASFRLSGADWDDGIGAHPDERYLVGVAEGLRWPDRLSPLRLAPGFPYGHVFPYLVALAGGRNRLPAARLLAGLLDTGTVMLAAALARSTGGRRAALGTATFLAVMPLHVQHAHFGIADIPLAFFTTGALLFGVRLAARGRLGDAALAGLWAGLAMGCKAGAVLLTLPLTAACLVGPGRDGHLLKRGMVAGGVALLVFAFTNPFALLGLRRFMANLATQAALVRGVVVVPYTLQYRGTLPYIYPIIQQLVWGMGPMLGLLCFGGLSLAVVRAIRRPLGASEWVRLAWALPYFAFIGGLFVKFPRYLLPLTPLLAVYAAQATERVSRWRPWVGWGAAASALLPAGLLSLALVASYQEPHPWAAASDWLEALPEGTTVAVEEWDHPLPLHADRFDLRILPIFDEDTERKWATVERVLAEADVLVIASRRGYGALTKWADRFPQTRAYYRALFDGELAFRAAACFGRWPRIGPLALADDSLRSTGLSSLPCRPGPPVVWLPRLDESFVVYDHPSVVIFWQVR